MRIGLIHYRAGLMDGVSLEMEKWRAVLTGMGHSVEIVAGNSCPGVDITIPGIEYNDVRNLALNERLYEKGEIETQALFEEIHERSEELLRDFDRELSRFDLLVPNNIWSLGWSLPAGLALYMYARDSGKPFISHNHDFWWDRPYYSSPHPGVVEILERYFPPSLENVSHITINSISAGDLLRRRKLRATVVPNVMDFAQQSWTSWEKNLQLRRLAGIAENDVVFLQATRVTERKAIELAVELVARFNSLSHVLKGRSLYTGREFSGRAHLVLTGLTEKRSLGYREKIDALASKLGVNVVDLSYHCCETQKEFFQSYSIADIVTYPSILEGWGNQLLEAMFARKPVALFKYAVFKSDIEDSGLSFVDLGNSYILEGGLVKIADEVFDRAIKNLVDLLFNRQKYLAATENNFSIGSKKFGYGALEGILRELLSSCSSL
ncbi:MAG: glycosyltransferase family 4 protein [Thermotogaceae bacterium]|nr:glycosyltransferase family 4 protein [Thermotogaceae bacterium]